MMDEAKDKPVSLAKFRELKAALLGRLSKQLQDEVEMNEWEVEENESDLWDSPVIDSKSVVKLSPIVEEMTGRKIKPEWIKPGGYDSVEEAVGDMLRQLELELEAQENQNE